MLTHPTSVPGPAMPLPTNASLHVRRTPECLQCISTAEQALFGSLFSAICLFGILGNIFVICVIVFSKKMLKSSINCLLLALAVADMGNLTVILPDIIMALYDKGWVIHTHFCPIIRYFEEMFLYGSLLLQVVICIERYFAICKPMAQRRLSRSQSIVLAFASGICAMMFAAPYAVYTHTFTLPKTNFDICYWDRSFVEEYVFGFKCFECMMLYILPLILFSFFYTRTAALLWGKQQVEVLHGGNTNMAEYMLKIRRSVVKMLIICLAIYFFCYSPIQTIFICEQLLTIAIIVPEWMRWIMNALTLANSSANPVVYIICCRQFRHKFLETLRKVPFLVNIVPAPQVFVAENLKTPMRAKSALRTHLMHAMRVQAHVNVDEMDDNDAKSTAEPTTTNVISPSVSAKQQARRDALDLCMLHQQQHKKAYEECVAEL